MFTVPAVLLVARRLRLHAVLHASGAAARDRHVHRCGRRRLSRLRHTLPRYSGARRGHAPAVGLERRAAESAAAGRPVRAGRRRSGPGWADRRQRDRRPAWPRWAAHTTSRCGCSTGARKRSTTCAALRGKTIAIGQRGSGTGRAGHDAAGIQRPDRAAHAHCSRSAGTPPPTCCCRAAPMPRSSWPDQTRR